ncbi:hypothetical protein KFE25_008118 [Diacronema lutheri]|uniref:Nicotinamide phosphoribosyltransferase n=2 Tax=Diacronema lutheri TaxID=2081491 RepID=A0A8J5XN98_DIALT|nr:hypothetical protein KFE25_008118 [Diacronema lutheri]
MGCTLANSASAGSMGDVFDNIMLLSDSYKTSHWRQYPPGTTTVYSYFESRGGKFAEVTFFGLQYILKRYLTGVVVTAAKIDAAEKIINAHMGQGEMKHFNRAGWEHIVKKHGGRLPIVIKALPEGMTVPVKNVLMTVENTDPECFWLSNYLETLLVQVWYPMTVCTQSREQKKVLADYFQRTGCEVSSPFSLGFQLNDFGTRGVSSMETAALGGAAHLVNFLGSDNMPANVFAAHYYGAKGPAGFSIPAAEHSTITSWQRDGEVDAYRNMLTQYPTGTVAVVSDSYDIFNAVSNLWGGELKEMIVKRDGRLVIRPDSGDPPKIVVQVLELLGKAFGTTTNAKGYKVLPPCVRVIQGDGVSYESLGVILESMAKAKWAAENVAFGSGGALLQKMDRDTQKCAFKCCEAVVNGKAVPVYKDPITDPGKQSKKGHLRLIKERTGKVTTLTDGLGTDADDLLVEVYRDGAMKREWTWEEVVSHAELGKTADKVA